MQKENYIGSLFIVAAPSGGGKTSLVRELVNNLQNIVTSISHTTRSMRPREEDGVNYFFISEQEFRRMIKNGEFVEHAKVFDNYYGTSVAQIDSCLQKGVDVVLDIDWQGAQQIKQMFSDAVSVFVIPPSLKILQNRLTARAQDKKEVIQSRMQRARSEMSHYAEFDFLLVNDDFAIAVDELVAIVKAKRLSITRQTKQQAKLLTSLLS